jgi:hypothetical protein
MADAQVPEVPDSNVPTKGAKKSVTPKGKQEPVQPVPPPDLYTELGIGSIFPNVVWADLTDPNGATLVNRPTVTIDQLTDMRRRDGQAKALIQLVTLPLRLSLGSR